MHLSNAELMALVENADEHIEDAADPRLKHLDSCAECRASLNRLEQEDGWLDQFVHCVREEDTDTLDAVEMTGASSILISMDPTGYAESGVTCD
ncbi:MAG: hypothetical protein AAF497_12115, partial [Planctomycetota bacterium]